MKKIAAVSIFKDEEDIAFNSVLSMAEEGIDVIIVADNMSTDSTRYELEKVQALLRNSSCNVVLYNDNEVGYYQSRKMSDLAHNAHKLFGADWVIPFDADEIFHSHEGRIKDVINDLPENINVIEASLFNHFPTSVDVESIIPFESMVWRQKEKGALPKVAVKYDKDMIIEQGNHSVTLKVPQIKANCLEIRHFPYRTWEQFKRKAINGAKAYQATNLVGFGDHWLLYNSLLEKWGDDVVRREVYEKYFSFFSPIDNEMILDPAPFRRWNKKNI